jgi:hypothetical protein
MAGAGDGSKPPIESQATACIKGEGGPMTRDDGLRCDVDADNRGGGVVDGVGRLKMRTDQENAILWRRPFTVLTVLVAGLSAWRWR